jgi:hypothetical protein
MSMLQVLAIQEHREDWDSENKVYPTDGTILTQINIDTDWLVKLGFASKGNNVWFKDLFEIHIIDNGKIYLRGWQNGICQIEYIHQLQNVYFFLTGYELRVS